jgi:hypothetical protein
MVWIVLFVGSVVVFAAFRMIPEAISDSHFPVFGLLRGTIAALAILAAIPAIFFVPIFVLWRLFGREQLGWRSLFDSADPSAVAAMFLLSSVLLGFAGLDTFSQADRWTRMSSSGELALATRTARFKLWFFSSIAMHLLRLYLLSSIAFSLVGSFFFQITNGYLREPAPEVLRLEFGILIILTMAFWIFAKVSHRNDFG